MTSKLVPMVVEEPTRTYEIETTDSRFRVTIPANWRVTFGAVVPTGKAAATGYSGSGWGLRFWEAQDKQRAVYSNVISFHDISIPIQVAAVRKFGSEDWYKDDGNYAKGTVEKGWKPIDEVRERETEPEPWDDVPKASKFNTTMRASRP